MSTGLHSVEDGDDKPTSGAAGADAREDPSNLALRSTPWATARSRRGIFPSGFPHYVEEFITPLYSHNCRRWGSIAAAAQPRVEAAGGGDRTGFDGSTAVVRVRVRYPVGVS